MKRSGITAVLAALVILASGCGSSGAKEIDAASLAASLASEVTYDDTLEALDEELSGMYFEMEENVTATLYMGSGTTAEEVAVFEAQDEDTAKTQLSHVQDYLDSQKEAVQDYQPEEVKRIEGAVVEQRGKYVILCVSADSTKAKEIIEEAFK
ncbi:MAG: DUF4358 domain-containing protein [Blautia sp.]|nr:DUF4358 domain-containing protein [Blautia sp.]